MKKKENNKIVIDFGRGTIKLMAFSFSKSGDLEIKEIREQKIKRFGVFDGKDFESDVIEKAFKKLILPLKDASIENKEKVISFSPDIMKAKLIEITYHRKKEGEISKSEEKEISLSVVEEAEKIFYQEKENEDSGKQKTSVKIIKKRIILKKVDGYKISKIIGLKQAKINFLVIILYTEGHYFNYSFPLLNRLNLSDNYFIAHEVEGLANFVRQNSKISPALFINIGEYTSQAVFFNIDAEIKLIKILKFGGYELTEAIIKKLGVSESEAERLKNDYSSGKLSKSASKKIEEIEKPTVEKWIKLFNNELREKISVFGGFPYPVYLFGGGSLFPMLIAALKKEKIDADIFSPSYINFINKSNNKIGPKEIPLLLLALMKKYE